MEQLLSPDEMARVDAAAPECGASLDDLMENAGAAVARAIMRRYRPCRVLVLAGPGNNGGDGYVVARRLEERGWPVVVGLAGVPRAGSVAAGAAARWRGLVVRADATRVRAADLVVDAVFGAGLSRDVAPDLAALLGAAKRLVAIDMPSGVDGATGTIRGFAPRAELTVTFVARKPGHCLLPGRELCGEVVCADIGMPRAAVARVLPILWRNTPALWHVPVPGAGGHKYDRGHLTILGGSLAGASVLAAQAARRVGAGLVTLAADSAVAAPPGVMIRTDPLDDLLADRRRLVWLCGPGLGADRAGLALDRLLRAERVVLADADALTACAGVSERLRGVAVITPHEGEFRRVFPDIEGDRLSRARAAAARAGAVVVLKGADTVIAGPDGRAAINDNAPATLATAGSGDTLAGLIAGLLVQGMAPFEAAAAGVWLHGDAGRRGGCGLIAEDIADHLPESLASIAGRPQNTP